MELQEFLKISDLQERLTKKMILTMFADFEDEPAKYTFEQDITIHLNGKPVKTTLGRYLFNKFVIPKQFFETEYVNEPMNKKVFKKFISRMSDLKNIEKKLSDEEYAQMIDRVDWLGQIVLKITGGGLTLDAVAVPQDVRNKIAKLVNSVDEHSPLQEIEKVDKEVKSLLSSYIDETFLGEILNSGAKGSITNMKMMFGYRGLIGDKFIKSSVENTDYEDLTKLNGLEGSFSRSVETAKGGYTMKLIMNGLSHTKIDMNTNDCGTKMGVKLKLTNPEPFYYSYIKLAKEGQYEVLTKENVSKYQGKNVTIRSPMFCKSKNGYCKKCFGDLWKINSITRNLGMIVNEVGADIMNKSMKKFHNLEQDFGTVNFKEALL